ncbi:LrgB family protein [Derxia lacustris]|uniref:LrgB family protein n=1 Tax=Derxia lacustris TaxID=764842 RepID=UPI000A16DCDE|nr:LrgB family protein [Derxia lacustris]
MNAGLPDLPGLATAAACLGGTVLAYALALAAYRRGGGSPWLIPVLTGTALVVLGLQLAGLPYARYREATAPLRLLAGPATVALAVPLHAQFAQLRRLGWALAVALLAGSAAGIVSAVLLARWLHLPELLVQSLAPKSVTMPIALALAEAGGGLAPVAALGVALTGIAGALLARPLLQALAVRDAAVRGFAIGMGAHAIGTARALQVDAVEGAMAALAMGLNGLATAVLLPLLLPALAGG